MPVNVKESEIKEFIEHYLSSPADAEAVATVTRIIQKGANESNFPKMVVLTFDQGVQRLGVENTIMNCWLTGMYMGIAFDQRRRELEELKRVQAMKQEPCPVCVAEAGDGGVIEIPCKKHGQPQ